MLRCSWPPAAADVGRLEPAEADEAGSRWAWEEAIELVRPASSPPCEMDVTCPSASTAMTSVDASILCSARHVEVYSIITPPSLSTQVRKEREARIVSTVKGAREGAVGNLFRLSFRYEFPEGAKVEALRLKFLSIKGDKSRLVVPEMSASVTWAPVRDGAAAAEAPPAAARKPPREAASAGQGPATAAEPKAESTEPSAAARSMMAAMGGTFSGSGRHPLLSSPMARQALAAAEAKVTAAAVAATEGSIAAANARIASLEAEVARQREELAALRALVLRGGVGEGKGGDG